MIPPAKFIELPGRIRIHYVEQGDPSGLPVVLLHGVTDSWHSFEPVLPLLPESFHAFALTQRGHGDSEHPATGYRTRDFAADVAAFMDAFDLHRAMIVGHSMGSLNSIRFAIDHPDRVSHLVLAAAFSRFRGNEVVEDFWKTTVSDIKDPIDPGLAREFQESTLANPIDGAFFDKVVSESLKAPAHVWRAAFEGFREDDFVNELNLITSPTLLLWGDQDAFCSRADQDALLKAIPHSRLVVYEGTGHALHWEQPKRFASDLVSFMESFS